MVKLGSESERQIDDMMLTRYAYHQIAQNGDPRKEGFKKIKGMIQETTWAHTAGRMVFRHGLTRMKERMHTDKC